MWKRPGGPSKPSQRRVRVTSACEPPPNRAETSISIEADRNAVHMIAMPSRAMRASSTQGER